MLEARQGDGFPDRERLTEIAGELGPQATAATLLQRIRDAAQTSADDMVACVVSSVAAAAAPIQQVEELEVDTKALRGPHIGVFLDACGVQASGLASLLVEAREIADAGGSALLRIERARSVAVKVAVLPGLCAPDWASAVAEASGSAEPALALPPSR